ncbi:MAG TPA: hypothetical protein VGR30_10685 [Candidatus Binatia bacterium]|jgi:hypothetical protein|nr:hypothetical protein [Candidatus Binatia bacterium]
MRKATLATFFLLVWNPAIQAQAPYYQGKTVTIVVGTVAGDLFIKTTKDPAFLAEAKKKRLDIDPSGGEEMATLAREVMSQPPEVIERIKKLMGK